MLYQSTRDSRLKVTCAEAIAQGLAPNGGLFVPEGFPQLTEAMITDLASKQYKSRAADIIGLFLDDFDADELCRSTSEAYSAPGFTHPNVAPLYKLDSTTNFLELWHGPTSAFKDMALQMLPRLLAASLRKTGEKRDVCILVATSGDTGKAALEGFRDVQGTKIMVFYPKDGVSDVQELQMTSQEGGNVNVVAVEGNFDDAQTGVKAIFSDLDFSNELSDRGFFLSSANSINWGRLVPQIAYYVSAYCDLVASRAVEVGGKVNFCVPTGNFGNILAGYYSEKMGLPINRLLCASNRNDVLADFINTGVYNKNRPFYTTVSPSMDILVSSNLERLLFELSNKDGAVVSGYMSELSGVGRYQIPESVRTEAARIIFGGCSSEEDTKKTISEVYYNHNYLIDTHTAVAYKVLGDYRAETGDDTTTVVVSTASPFKFCDSVLDALGKPSKTKGVSAIDALADFSGVHAPEPLRQLSSKTPRFQDSVQTSEMKLAVKRFLTRGE